MQRNKVGLLIAAAGAAYAYYHYTRMTPEERTNLKTKGKDLFTKAFGGAGNMFGNTNAAPDANKY